MQTTDHALLGWVNSGKSKRSAVTLGQLALLLELVGSDSVAALSGGSESQAVNYRQKLGRLEQRLGVGSLTQLVGNSTQPTTTGRRVAAEVRMLLEEMQCGAESASSAPTWIIGAGEAWLQSVIVPALGEIVDANTKWRWEVQNLMAHEIRESVREGSIHFGFVRAGDLHKDDKIFESRTYPTSGYIVVAGDVSGSSRDPKDLITWLLDHKRPLVQQGSSWNPIRKLVMKTLGIKKALMQIDPVVRCETHPQAVAAAERGKSWCVVPASLVGSSRLDLFVSAPIRCPEAESDMTLLSNSRRLSKLPDSESALDALKTALGKALQRGGR